MILETERLMLREMTQSDFDDLAEMLCDPEVMYAYERDFPMKTSGNGLTISCRVTKNTVSVCGA